VFRDKLAFELGRLFLRYDNSQNAAAAIVGKIINFIKCNKKCLLDNSAVLYLMSHWINYGLSIPK